MYSAGGRVDFIHAGFPIRRSTDRRLLTAPRRLTQFCHVLHRLLVPRHPPNALTSLTTETLTDLLSELDAFRQMAKSHLSLCSPSQDGFLQRRISLGRSSTIVSDAMSEKLTDRASCFVQLFDCQLGRVPSGWAREDLNFRPRAYQARALTN
jgi:hypothetical protein